MAKEDKWLGKALRHLESHADFPRIQVQMRDRLQEAERNAPAAARVYGSQARLKYVLQRFDIRAQTWLELVSDIAMQNAFMAIVESFVPMAWAEYTGASLEVLHPVSAEAEANLESIHARVPHWIGEGYKRLEQRRDELNREGQAAPNAGKTAATGRTNRYPRTTLQVSKWEDIQISFLSEFKIEIRIGQECEFWNYADLGFADRRTGSPNTLWQMLRRIAESDGSFRETTGTVGRPRAVLEKRVERLRTFLRHYFNLPGDPLPYAPGNGYRARFEICCGPSYNT